MKSKFNATENELSEIKKKLADEQNIRHEEEQRKE